MTYYGLSISPHCIIGTSPSEVKETFRSLEVVAPRCKTTEILEKICKRIEETPRLWLRSEFSCLHQDHYFDAYITDTFTFKINANAYEHIVAESTKTHHQKWGQLHQFQINNESLSFLPHTIIKALQQHNWQQYLPKITPWLEQYQEFLENDGPITQAHKEGDRIYKLSPISVPKDSFLAPPPTETN